MLLPRLLLGAGKSNATATADSTSENLLKIMAEKKIPRRIPRRLAGTRRMLVTPDRVEFLLSPLMADASTGELWAESLAQWLLKHPDRIPELQPSGRFHSKTFAFVLTHRKMTSELRARLARYRHLLPHML